MSLTYGEVAQILKIIEASTLDEVVLELGGTRLVVRRGGSSPAVASPPRMAEPATRATTDAPSAPDRAGPATPRAAAAAGGCEIRAPMVGTFYRRPSPNDPPFAEVGSRIKAGDPVCLIEVMKLYNTITAPVSGTIEAVLADDAALVAFDQVLVVIRPD